MYLATSKKNIISLSLEQHTMMALFLANGFPMPFNLKRRQARSGEARWLAIFGLIADVVRAHPQLHGSRTS